MKSKGKTYWKKRIYNVDVFLSQIKENFYDNMRKETKSYCTFIPVENLFNYVLKELTENFTTLIQVLKND